ncbi:ribosomal protein [Tanacetum coccineum]|uniref:Ribosomal protein n=1 Tax=Tanacetum coccineum TaxID=301880 RepID=A0ABQ5D4C2_9ASTR
MPRSTNKASKAKRTGKCHMCGDTGHYARDCKERKTDSEEVVLHDTMKCHVCGETGHYARECKDKKSDTVKVALKAIIGSGTRSNKKAQGWYLNCGSSEHRYVAGEIYSTSGLVAGETVVGVVNGKTFPSVNPQRKVGPSNFFRSRIGATVAVDRFPATCRWETF